ncbi:MAG: hypothetical protein JNM68_06950, partial [Dinghuibacter sp.]|nr:hypothetical protein [Dinghuibacter sp.]
APVKMWTDNWTNWDPQNAAYPATTVNVSGNISANTTWTSNNVYLLQGIVYIDSLVTLTIEPGTIIRGDFNTANSSLLVRRGAKLNAEGTQCNPIVFTSNRNVGERAPGDWGGIIVLGRARHNLGTNNLIEGLSAANVAHYHGGTNDNDNSGVIKYVRIEYGGFVFSANNEINGLTMGSVGRGTVVDYVQSSFVNDDAFEWFGGTVNCKHLVAYRVIDDNFDTDNGFSGTVQYALGIKDPALADVSTSEGFESDNDNPGTAENRYPKTSATFYNVTEIGAYRCTTPAPVVNSLHNRGARLRRNTDLKIYNSIFMNFRNGLFVDGTLAVNNANQDSLVFRNNLIAADYTTYPTHLAAENAATRTILFNPAYSNDSLNSCSVLVNAYDFLNPDYRPNLAGAGSILTSNLQQGPDLTPVVEVDNALFPPTAASDFIVNVIENGTGTTNGIITVSIPKISGWDITVPGLTLSGTNQSGTNGTSNVNGGTPTNNGDWFFRDNGTTIIATSKAGIVIPKGNASVIGFVATRKAATSSGTNQNLGVTVNGGGDTTPANNGASVGLSTSN